MIDMIIVIGIILMMIMMIMMIITMIMVIVIATTCVKSATTANIFKIGIHIYIDINCLYIHKKYVYYISLLKYSQLHL